VYSHFNGKSKTGIRNNKGNESIDVHDVRNTCVKNILWYLKYTYDDSLSKERKRKEGKISNN
jgi:hypothetical protein